MRTLVLRFGLLAAFLIMSTAAQATTVLFDGDDFASLQGSDGSLTIVATATPGQYQVTWSLDTTGFNDALAVSTNHEYLQSLAFKAFTDVTAVSVVAGGVAGTLYWPSNVSNTSPNCDSASSAGFICFDVNPDVLATTNGVISKTFLVTGTVDASLAWSFRGKYGPATGWVISEQAPPIPEPASAAVFGLGALIVGAALRRKRAS